MRGYGLVDSPKVATRAGQDPQPDRRDRAQPRRRGAVLSGDLLVFDAQDPGQEPLPRHRRQGQRHSRSLQDAGSMAQLHQDQWLRQLPPDGQLRDADHLGRARQVRIVAGRLGLPPVGRPGRPRHGALHHPVDDAGRRPARRARRLDRPHQGRRTAEPQPAAAGRRRAQPGRHRARLARPQALSARSDHDRPAQPDDQRLRPDLRRHRAAAATRSRCSTRCTTPKRTIQPPVREDTPSSALANQVTNALALFRHGADLGQQGQRAHLGDGPGRARLLGSAKPLAEGHPGLLQEGLAVALGAALSARRAARRLLPELAPGDGL